MFCSKCGTQNLESSKFCFNCGNALTKKINTQMKEPSEQHLTQITKMASMPELKVAKKSAKESSFGAELPVKNKSSKFKIWWDKFAGAEKILAVGLTILVFVALLYGFGSYVLDSVRDSGRDSGRNNRSSHVSENTTSIRFDRSLYYTGISRNDLLRYPDDYIGSNVKFGRCYVLQVLEDKVYVVNNGKSTGSNYLIIDDRNNKGANALEGDQVTVFGSFSGNGSYGTSTVPIIKADRMIVNNVMPTNFDEFTQALVNGINHNRYLYKSGETTYLEGTSLQWVMAIYGTGYSTDLMIYDHTQGTPLDETYVPDVDGYDVFMKFQFAEDLIDPINAGAIVPGEWSEIFPIRVNGTLTKIEQNPLNHCIYNVTFVIESFEPYDSYR